ncbi:hypothetical protein NQZ68_033602 [Dissostichus eleginoides]|nr:hypothetical protein NQZ68_033602 [Dissostichus eleginoides]
MSELIPSMIPAEDLLPSAGPSHHHVDNVSHLISTQLHRVAVFSTIIFKTPNEGICRWGNSDKEALEPFCGFKVDKAQGGPGGSRRRRWTGVHRGFQEGIKTGVRQDDRRHRKQELATLDKLLELKVRDMTETN